MWGLCNNGLTDNEEEVKMERVAQIEARISELKIQLAAEADALAYVDYADGQAYYEERRRFTQIREELFAAERELRALTVHTCHIPQEIASQRLREKMEIARRARLEVALAKIEQIFGGK